MFTWWELCVCATNSKLTGRLVGLTITTLTGVGPVAAFFSSRLPQDVMTVSSIQPEQITAKANRTERVRLGIAPNPPQRTFRIINLPSVKVVPLPATLPWASFKTYPASAVIVLPVRAITVSLLLPGRYEHRYYLASGLCPRLPADVYPVNYTIVKGL